MAALAIGQGQYTLLLNERGGVIDDLIVYRYEKEAFFLRILMPGDYRYEGADLGILVMRGRSMTNNFKLTERSKRWIDGIKSAFSARPLPSAAALPDPAFKIL